MTPVIGAALTLLAADQAASSPPWDAISGLVVGIVAGAVGVGLAWAAAASQQRDRRRTRCAEAYKAALSWNEMLYRIRRRTDGPDQETALVERFHELQEEISFHQGWLMAEDPALGRSYDRLVCHIKKETEELIRAAWSCAGRRPTEAPPDGEKNPAIKSECERFLTDVREHLSPRPWVRRRVKTRNPEEAPK